MPLVKTPRYKEYLQFLRSRAPEKTVSHCIFVAEYLTSFAEGLGIAHDDAAAAGLLHDVCRRASAQELLAQAREYGLPLGEAQLARPMLLHGAVGAELVKRDLGIDDEGVCEAIAWHTTGRPGLGVLGQALYVADFAEPTRKYPAAGEAREILRREGFSAALRFVAKCKAGHVSKAGVVEPNGAAFHCWLSREFGDGD